MAIAPPAKAPGRTCQATPGEARQMPMWNFAAMAQAGLTGRTRNVARPVASGRPHGRCRIKAGRAGRQPADAPSANAKSQQGKVAW
jgi:hypothetical protein